ncbi:hypothetical protein HZZ13_10915 [Bradyrhizobium sp. CNPSo 4010]|uniref:DUF4149 domain-containing protein n=1 Tax=Bradyrhizobium agreste TaxID=2751811 RepID=A0ABS0PM80_9BRAD|nr:hypothetical protein [Bradyrhizobium agreste]MBH5398298.1 hypothetical protein [Bradyrhizobium agreste]
MSASKLLTHLSVWAGLWLAPLVWAANMQLGQILPYADCRSQLHASAMTSFVGAALTIASGLASWLTPRKLTADREEHRANADFGSAVSALSAGLFTFALLMQGIAAMVLTGCER